jgi:acyl-CoA thioester hydrolase
VQGALQDFFVALQQISGGFLKSGHFTRGTQIPGSRTEPRKTLAKSSAMPEHKPPKPTPEPRSAYCVLRPITTRWMDNDAYGHVNNVVYYSWFDTAVNAYLIEQGALDIHAGSTIGLVIETQCNYFAPLAFPQTVEAGIRVAHLGTSSVRYEIGIFGADALCAAKGHFVHVYVDAATRRPTALPEKLKTVLETLR